MAGEHSEGILGMMTEKLAPLLNFNIAARSQGDNFPVSRIVLHRLLTTGLDEVIHYGHRYDHMEHLDSGRVKVHFTNGTSTEGDILVAADGVNSAIRKQILPESFGPGKVGTTGIAGKVFLDTKQLLDDIPQLKRGICIIAGTEGRGLFIAPQIYSPEAKFQITRLFSGTEGVTHESQLLPNATGDDLLLLGGKDKKKLIDDAKDYVFYGYLTKHAETDFPNLKEISQQEMLDRIVAQMEKSEWNPVLMKMVKMTDVNTVGYWPLHVSPKITDLSSHKPSNITFLGDSIHASISHTLECPTLMIVPPTGGEGGNTAIRDAAKLLETIKIIESADDVKEAIEMEIPKYEKEMLSFAADVVSRSVRNAKMITAEGYILPYIVRGILRVINFFFGAKV
jgi:2-polyprenyl-6-methoxyphenol hydroxylase-like FAD-dependent oxidoreductase